MDARMQTPFTMIVASPSKSGKTTFVSDMLKKSDQFFSQSQKRIYYFYNIWSPTFNELEESGVVTRFIEGLCTPDFIEEHCSKSDGRVTIVLDDQAYQVNEHIASMFAVGSHQHGVNFIILAQNIFTKNKHFRDVSLNATYIVLGKNPRDKSSIKYLARQIYPSEAKVLEDAYYKATETPYSFFLIDFHQGTAENARMRSNVLATRGPSVLYLKN